MPRHMLKLLALLMALFVAPASADRGGVKHVAAPAVVAWDDQSITCPYARARAEAAAREVALAKAEPTTITLDDRISPDSSLFTIERGSSTLTP
jgi:hypothetical protein